MDQQQNQQELDFLTQQKIELLLNMRAKKFDDGIAELKDLVTNLQTDLFALRKQVQNLQSASVAPEAPMPFAATPARSPIPGREEPVITPVITPRAPPMQASPVQPVQAAPAPPVPKKEEHPRQGKYNSEDVSIEKYFNFSGK